MSAPLRIGEPTTSALPSGTFQSSKSRERLRSELAGDGELRRNLQPAIRLRQVREPAPRGARPRPPPLRLTPCGWLVGPLQGRKLRIASSRVMCARSGFLTRFGGFFFAQLPLERVATAVWEFSCVVPSQHGKLVDLIVEFDMLRSGSVPITRFRIGRAQSVLCRWDAHALIFQELDCATFHWNEWILVCEGNNAVCEVVF